MKLPQDKKERAKVLILIAVGAAGILYGLGVGVLSPVMKGRKANAARIEELDGKIQKARSAISQMQRTASLNAGVAEGIVEVANRKKHVLHDRLGNYLLGAQEVLDAHARRSGVVLDSVSEIGQSQIPGNPASTGGSAFRSYTVRVTLQTGFPNLIRFLTEVETDNPYLCVSSLTVAGQAAKPDVHDVTVDIQWPIWASAELSSQIEAQLEDQKQTGREAPRPAPDVARQQEEAPRQ